METDQQEIMDKIRHIVAKVIEVDASTITPTSRFQQDHGADSMGAIEVLSQLEKTFGIQIAEDDLGEMNTLDGTYGVVRKGLERRK